MCAASGGVTLWAVGADRGGGGGGGRKGWLEAEPAGAFVVVGGSGNVGSGRGGAIKSGFHQGDVGPEVKIVNADSARCVVKEPPRSALLGVLVMASGPRV